jgi:uncharacterized protein (DUF2252 family)
MTGTARDEYEAGTALRKAVPRSSHAAWEPPGDRPDPASVIFRQDADRLKDLVPIRHERMAAGPFAFLRGSAAVMATDLAGTPRTGITVQACGDAHAANFGVYASPERTLVFDVNDFDETLPGPWEWDLKRLATSLAVAARDQEYDDGLARTLARRAATGYREEMRRLAGMTNLDVYYRMVRADDSVAEIKRSGARAKARRMMDRARAHTNLQAVAKLTTLVDGRLRIADDPPLLERDASPQTAEMVRHSLAEYTRTLRADVAALLRSYRYVDAGRKVVGVGSVGTRCFVVVLAGRDGQDPLVLQVKEARRSVLEPFLTPSAYQKQGRRVVAGQQMLQAVSDVFLGWSTDFYWRQLRDMKGSVEVAKLRPYGLKLYADLCARTLALAHARSGSRFRIAGYLGRSTVFDEAVADFAMAYADQTLADHAAFVEAR